MKALVWHGKRDVRIDTVPDPTIEAPTDVVIEVTSSGICGSDLHLYDVLTMFLHEGDILGHEPMGRVVAVGNEVNNVHVGDRIVVPFNISCGHCFMCDRQLYAQCETTQVVEHDKGAALYGYTELYGSVPGGQAELLRVPHADFGAIKVGDAHDDRYVYLSDVLPTSWQAVDYAEVPEGGSVLVVGLGPIGQMTARIARHRGAGTVIGVDTVPERLALARRWGVDTIDGSHRSDADLLAEIRERTDGRGPDSAIDAVGMEAHGSPLLATMQKAAGMLPDRLAAPLTERFGVDRLAALTFTLDAVRRGGTVSIIGVYGGMKDPLPMMTMFDKGLTIRMGQAHVKRWIPHILPLVEDDADPLGTMDLATHHISLDEAPAAYETFQQKADGMIKAVINPS
jgi:threonine dehydrogenase-like Zn-dependent dehydrogenase